MVYNKYMDILDDQRPWGSFRQFTKGNPVTVKILFVKAGESFSLQYHHERDEFWRILSGSPDVTVGEKTETAHAGDEFFIVREVPHRISGGEEDASVLEIAFGDFDEGDIVRLEDKYGRTSP
jgi:mannose-6-phosphate isomerase-like protein (cupin superfamily)